MKKKKTLDWGNQRQIAFKFMYLGKNYNGLVVQSSTKNTIEEVLFTVMRKCCLVEDKPTEELMSLQNYSRCGRTDKGVNSSGNVFSLSLRYNPNYNYTKLLNNLLPDDIYIIGAKEVDDTFDARFSCLYREYKYYFLKKNMNIERMKEGCKLLTGVHNFKKFCKIDKSDENWETKNYERRLYEMRIEKCDSFVFPFRDTQTITEYYQPYVCIIKGSAFLWHQVRCMMGILFLIGEGLEEVDIIKEMLKSDSQKDFKYSIADDTNLVLTDCAFEFFNFDVDEIATANMFFKLEKISQKILVENIVNTHFFNIMFNTSPIFSSMEISNAIEHLSRNYRRTTKYTKMLNHKTNRDNN